MPTSEIRERAKRLYEQAVQEYTARAPGIHLKDWELLSASDVEDWELYAEELIEEESQCQETK